MHCAASAHAYPDMSECVPAKRTLATEAGEYHEIGDTIYEEKK